MIAGVDISSGLNFGWRKRLPVVLQTESTECALACVAMIARYHGHNVNLPSLRRRFSTSLRGLDLSGVVDIASSLKLRCRALRVDLEALSRLKTPCILHWDMNHFVVLKGISQRRIIIHDPVCGVRKLRINEVSQHFTGVALELEPGPDFRPVKDVEKIRLSSLTGTIHGLVGALIVIFVLALGLELFFLAGPFYLQWVLDRVIVTSDKSLMTLLGIAFIFVAVFKVVITGFRDWAVTWLSATVSAQWISNIFSHLLRLPSDWFEKRHIGDVVSRFGSVDKIQQTLTTEFVSVLLDGLMAVLTLVIMCLYSLRLTLLVVGAFLLYGILRWILFRPLRGAEEGLIICKARQHTQLLEAIRGVQTLKLHNKQAICGAQYSNYVIDSINKNVSAQRLDIISRIGKDLIFGLEWVLLIWFAVLMVMNGLITVGMLVAFIAYAEQFTTRSGKLIDKAIELRMLGLHLERLADIAAAEPEKFLTSTHAGDIPDATIELRNVSFRYSNNDPWILKNCNLRIAYGTSIAITGASGCGKTTLAKIMLGLLQPGEGAVLYGGVDIRVLGLSAYRDKVGAVLQDDHLFEGSVADNIAFFDPKSTMSAITESARNAGIHDDIMTMPMGYETLVGDMGSSLSGGQQQRVLLARALFRKPRLLVLDEATSSLDARREREVNQAIHDIRITRIVIAHRSNTIESADRVVVMDKGHVKDCSGICDLEI